MNIAVADPSSLTILDSFLVSKKHKMFTVSSLVGVTTHFSNPPSTIHQICIKPFFHSWPRFTAVIASVFNARSLFIRTWKDGVVFGTGVYDSRGPRVYPGKKDTVRAPIAGANLGKADVSEYFSIRCISSYADPFQFPFTMGAPHFPHPITGPKPMKVPWSLAVLSWFCFQSNTEKCLKVWPTKASLVPSPCI